MEKQHIKQECLNIVSNPSLDDIKLYYRLSWIPESSSNLSAATWAVALLIVSKLALLCTFAVSTEMTSACSPDGGICHVAVRLPWAFYNLTTQDLKFKVFIGGVPFPEASRPSSACMKKVRVYGHDNGNSLAILLVHYVLHAKKRNKRNLELLMSQLVHCLSQQRISIIFLFRALLTSTKQTSFQTWSSYWSESIARLRWSNRKDRLSPIYHKAHKYHHIAAEGLKTSCTHF